MTILYLDAGNSAVKYLSSDNRISGVESSLSFLASLLKGNAFGALVMADVIDMAPQVKSLCDHLQLPFFSIGVEHNFCGLQLVYRDADCLGVDRWLAMLAARSLLPQQSLIVVDLGTALTIEVVDQSKGHIGGVIAPGLAIGAKALMQHTNLSLDVALEKFSGQLGDDTESCINYGLCDSAIGLIERASANFIADATVVITGGDAGLISPHLRIPHHHVADLVFTGMKTYAAQKTYLRELI